MTCGAVTKNGSYCEAHGVEGGTRSRAGRAGRDRDPLRAAKKRLLYGTPEYRKASKLLRETGGVCHLCNQPVPPGTGQADHLEAGNPYSPLALAHAKCNQSRGNREITRK